jgi:predicted  nucleic acid-binding Zn-ribbon protein
MHTKQYFGELPIRDIDFAERTDRSSHDIVVELVHRMVASSKQIVAAKTEHERTALQRQIDATDREIDQLAYELYGLTDEEIRIVEEATR